MDKAAGAKALRELSLYLQLKGENAFKTRAYDIASERIAGLSEDLGELVTQRHLTSLPGIGESIATKITELVTTGKMPALEELKAQYPPRILDLLTVQDLGPKKAKALYSELGVGASTSSSGPAEKGGCAWPQGLRCQDRGEAPFEPGPRPAPAIGREPPPLGRRAAPGRSAAPAG